MIFFDEDNEAKDEQQLQRTIITLPLRALHKRTSDFHSSKLIRNMFEQAPVENEYITPPEVETVQTKPKSLEKQQKRRMLKKKTHLRTEVANIQQHLQAEDSIKVPEPISRIEQADPGYFYEQQSQEHQREQTQTPHQTNVRDYETAATHKQMSTKLDLDTFNMMIAECKVLEDTRNLLNQLLPFEGATFRIVRRKNTIFTTFSLLTYDGRDHAEKRFLMATRGFVGMDKTRYPVSSISKVKQDVVGSGYDMGIMASDFVRNCYKIHSYKYKGDREVFISFEDIMFGSRQVSLQIRDQQNSRPMKYWNLPEAALTSFDKQMVGSKRNIIMGKSKPINEMKASDLVLKLRKIGPQSFLMTVGRQLTVLEAFCFSVAHLDRQA